MEIAAIEEILRLLDPIQTKVNNLGKCDQPMGDYCLNPDRWRWMGWHQWNVQEMCSGCAACWHLGCAVNELRSLLRREEISQRV